jgi:hypothetical protein
VGRTSDPKEPDDAETQPATTDDRRHTTIPHVENRGEPRRASKHLARTAKEYGQADVEENLTATGAVKQEEKRTVEPGNKKREDERRGNGK